MKKMIFAIALAIICSATLWADINIGGGYFGHVITHPGIMVEAEAEQIESNGVSALARMSVAAFVQPRYHTGLLLDAGLGMRREFRSGIFLEESLGVGCLVSYINSDGIYSVANDGTVSAAPRLNPLDLTASLGVGFGYRFKAGNNGALLIWARPRVFWQFPYKLTSTFTPVLQVGVTHTVLNSSRR